MTETILQNLQNEEFSRALITFVDINSGRKIKISSEKILATRFSLEKEIHLGCFKNELEIEFACDSLTINI